MAFEIIIEEVPSIRSEKTEDRAVDFTQADCDRITQCIEAREWDDALKLCERARRMTDRALYIEAGGGPASKVESTIKVYQDRYNRLAQAKEARNWYRVVAVAREILKDCPTDDATFGDLKAAMEKLRRQHKRSIRSSLIAIILFGLAAWFLATAVWYNVQLHRFHEAKQSRNFAQAVVLAESLQRRWPELAGFVLAANRRRDVRQLWHGLQQELSDEHCAIITSELDDTDTELARADDATAYGEAATRFDDILQGFEHLSSAVAARAKFEALRDEVQPDYFSADCRDCSVRFTEMEDADTDARSAFDRIDFATAAGKWDEALSLAMLVLFHAALSRRDFAGAEELVQLAPDIEGGDEFLSAFSTRGISLAKLKALPGLPPSWSSTLRGRRADGESGLATIRFDDARQAFEQLSNLCAEAESAHAIKEEVARLETSATGGIDSSRYPARLRAVLSEVQDRSQDAKRFAAQGEFGKATAVGRGAKDILEDNGDALRQARRVILAFIDADARLDQCLADAKTSYNTSEAFQPLAAAAETYSNYAEHHEYDVGSLQFAKRIVQAVTDTDTALKEMTSAERLQQPVEVFGHGEKAKSSLQLLRNLRVTAYATDAKLAEIGRAMDKARKAVGNEAERILAAARKAKEASDFTLLRMPLDAYTDLMGKLREPLAIEAKIYREQLDTYDKAAIEMRNGLAAVGRDDYGRAVGLLTGALELYGRIGVASHSNSINQKIALCTALTNLERAENALRTCGNAAEVAMQEMAVDEIRRACRTKVAADDVEVVEQRSRRISASAAAYKVKIRQERQRFEADSATRRARYAVAKRLAISEFTRIKDKATAVQRLRRKRQRCNELKSLANTLQVERGIYSKLIAGDVAVRNAADAADNYLRLKRQSYCNTILPPP